jgi:hypothetical protein
MCMAGLGMLGPMMQLGGAMMGASATAAEGRRAREIAEKNAELKRQQGVYQAKQVRRKAGYTNSTAVTQATGNGLMISGSAFDIIVDNAVQGEVDAYNVQKAAEDEAHVIQLEGHAAQQRANNQATGMLIGGFSKFLGVAA